MTDIPDLSEFIAASDAAYLAFKKYNKKIDYDNVQKIEDDEELESYDGNYGSET